MRCSSCRVVVAAGTTTCPNCGAAIVAEESAPRPPSGARPPAAAAAAPPAPRTRLAAATFPVQVDVDSPLEIARWRPLVHWLLAIPHLVITQVLGQVQEVVALISFFAVLFTKRIPEGLFNFQVMTMRYSFRTYSYALWMREPYPPFEFPMTPEDPGTDPARLSVANPGEVNRWLPLVKWLLLIPHYIVLLFLFIGAFFAILIGWFAVLITGRWPEGLRSYVVGVMRWGTRVQAYFLLLRDEYPPFSLT